MDQFHIVVRSDSGIRAVSHGTEQDVFKLLDGTSFPLDKWEVYSDTTGSYTPAEEFVKYHRQGVKIARETAEHARNTTVLQLVISAMHKQDTATRFEDQDGMDIVAKQTAEAIIKLFER